MSLTNSQQIALRKIKQFLQHDEQIFILTGRAGTGKISIIKEIITLAKQSALSLQIMAATGSAVNALRQAKINGVQTLHRSIYNHGQKTVSVNSQDTQITAVRFNFPIRIDTQTQLFIIYGGAMISNQKNPKSRLQFGSGKTLDDLITATNVKMGHSQIIMIGDDYQLPAANESHAPALEQSYYRDQQLRVQKFEMTDIDSTLANPLNKFLGQLANMIDDPSKRLIYEWPSNQHEIYNFDTLYHDPQKAHDAVVQQFHHHSPLQSCVITNNNAQAQEYNQQIRQKLNLQGVIAPKDLVVFTRNQYDLPLWQDGRLVKKDIFAGTTAKITWVAKQPEIRKSSKYRLRFRQVRFYFLNDNPHNVYQAELFENILTGNNVRITDQEAVALYQDLYERYQENHPQAMDDLRKHNRQVESDQQHRTHDARTKEYLKAAANKLSRYVEVPATNSLSAQRYRQVIKQLLRRYPQADPRRDCRRQKLPNGLEKLLETDQYYNCLEVQYAYTRNCYRAEEEKWSDVYLDNEFVNETSEHQLRFTYTAVSCAKQHLAVLNTINVFAKFKLKISPTTQTRKASAQNFQPLSQFIIPNSLIVSLLRRLKHLSAITGVKIIGVTPQTLKKYYLMVYFRSTATFRIQFYYSTKNGWTTANLMADQALLNEDQPLKQLVQQLQKLPTERS